MRAFVTLEDFCVGCPGRPNGTNMIKFHRKNEFIVLGRIVGKGQNSKREKQVTTAFDVFDFDPGYLKKEKKSFWLSKQVSGGLRTNHNTRKRKSDKSCYQYIVDRYVNFISVFFFPSQKTMFFACKSPNCSLYWYSSEYFFSLRSAQLVTHA